MRQHLSGKISAENLKFDYSYLFILKHHYLEHTNERHFVCFGWNAIYVNTNKNNKTYKTLEA